MDETELPRLPTTPTGAYRHYKVGEYVFQQSTAAAVPAGNRAARCAVRA